MPRALNTRTAAVVDPILSTHARGYRNGEFISHELFPRANVTNRAMRQIKFGKESFRMINTRRAPGSNKKRVQFGYASDPINLVQNALEGVVPVEHQEEAETVPGIDLGRGAVDMVLAIEDLNLEFEAAQLARNPANYDANHKLALVGADRWTDPSSDPAGDVNAAREMVRRSIGRYPNTLALGASAFAALKDHPKIAEKFKYTSSDSLTEAMLASYFSIEKVVVGKAVYLPETAPDDALANDVWGNDALLAWVPRGEGNFQVPSFGYTYTLTGYPQVNKPYFEDQTDSWIYPIKVERKPTLLGAEAGFLLQNAGAA